MSKDPNDNRTAQLPPSDIERAQVLARLIDQQIRNLYTAKDAGSFTQAQARELYVLERIRADWLLEGAR